MSQAFAVVTGEVRAIVQHVHLVHTHTLERPVGGRRLEHIEHRHRLTVGEGDDDVPTRTDQVEDGRCLRRLGEHVASIAGTRRRRAPALSPSYRCPTQIELHTDHPVTEAAAYAARLSERKHRGSST